MKTAHTILVVDDELQNRKLFEALLKPEGYKIITAKSGEEALICIKVTAPDLILLDLMMPGMNGFEVARILKSSAATSNIPIVMVTAQTTSGALLEGLDAGVEEFLTKPINRPELWLRVRNLLRLKELRDIVDTHNQTLAMDVESRTMELQRFRSAMDQTGDAIFLLDHHTNTFIDVNATTTSMFGYGRSEFLEFGHIELEANTQIALERLRDAMVGGTPGENLSTAKIRRKDGSSVAIEIFRQPRRSDDDSITVGIVRDITEREVAHLRLYQLAHHDALTGLPNRTLFYETLSRTLESAESNGWTVGVLFIDIDHFKKVNDTHGHAVGDTLLSQISNRLSSCVRLRDTVGRLGGDEFAIILIMDAQTNGAEIVANKIRSALNDPFTIFGNKVAITASTGIAVYPDDATDAETLITFADTAMYRAKQSGRDQHCVFTTQMNDELLTQLSAESALRKAIDDNQFEIHYQPKVDVSSGRISGLEALLRWQRPGYGLVAPKYFIPLLEETGMIVPVGEWVIDNVCKQIKEWHHSDIGNVQVSVNVSGRQFVNNDLNQQVMKSIEASGIPGTLLELELTESLLMQNTEVNIASLVDLKRHGIELSIDDFGTGFSSLASLHRFPIDKVKIDIAFVRQIIGPFGDPTIAQTIIQMAHGLKMKVVAEGVETNDQFQYLRHHGCDQIQGFLFSPALPLNEVEELLRENAHRSSAGYAVSEMSSSLNPLESSKLEVSEQLLSDRS
jgi:diguanylate cyclase (GGDEF)-like protein/PAS domain S-box-containing protein